MKSMKFYFGSTFRFIQNYLVYEAFKRKDLLMSMLQGFTKDSNTFDAETFRQNAFCLLDARNTFVLPIASAFAESIEDHNEIKSKVIFGYFYCFNILNKKEY